MGSSKDHIGYVQSMPEASVECNNLSKNVCEVRDGG
jgi:hypothetical protein